MVGKISDISTTVTAPVATGTLIEVEKPDGTSGKLDLSTVGGGLDLIESYTGTGSTGTKTFSSIPSIYTDLVLEITGRSTAAAITDVHTVTVNGLGGTNYDRQRLYATSTTVTADQSIAAASWGDVLTLAAASCTSTFVGGGQLTIFNYAGTSIGKAMLATGRQPADASTGAGYIIHTSGQVRTTSPISSLTCALTSGSFTTSTLIRLYGRI